MKDKAFFAGSVFPPLIIGGIVAIISVIAYIMNREFSVGLFFFLLTVLITGALINFAKADEQGITFFSFLCIPTRYNYSDIAAKISLEAKPEVRSPGATFLFLKNGSRKLLKLGLYPEKTQLKIQELLESKIKTDFTFFHDTERWNIWFQSARKKVVTKRYLIGLLLILIGLTFQVKTVVWNWKVKHWTKGSAVIEVNETDDDNEYTFRYRYRYQGKNYTGSEIVGGAKRATSDYVPGMAVPCIINPEKPQEAAVLTKYRADWLLCTGGWFLMLAGLPFLIIATIILRKKINIPEELKSLSKKFTIEKLKELTFLVCGECKISVGKIAGEYREIEGRYGCFPPHHPILSLLVQIFFLGISILLGIHIMPHFYIAAFMLSVLIWKTIFPRGVVFDRTEKKLYWFRFFSCKSIPAKMKYNEVLKSEDVVALALKIRNDGILLLSGVRKDGVTIPIARAADKYMEQLFSDTVKLTHNLANLPIIIL